MDRGELVPDELFESVVDPILAQAPSDKPLILDGFVRLLSDEAWLEQRLQNMGRKIDWVIFIDVDEATTAKRLMLRHRDDDAAGALEERWVEYRRETLPVIESMKSHFRFMAVDGTKSIEEVDAQIMEQGL
jgi:adenylate kinase